MLSSDDGSSVILTCLMFRHNYVDHIAPVYIECMWLGLKVSECVVEFFLKIVVFSPLFDH